MPRSDKPCGEELVVVKGFEKIAKQVEAVCQRLTSETAVDAEFQISIGHARDGVRVNGFQRLTTILDSADYLLNLQKKIADGLKEFQRATLCMEQLVQQSQKLMQNYQRCPRCKGKKGNKIPWQKVTTPEARQWVDCEACAGRGMIR